MQNKTKRSGTTASRGETKTKRSETKAKRGEAKTKQGAHAAPSTTVVDQLAEMVRREVQAKLGPNSTFEQRRDAAAGLMRETLWKDADTDLRESVTDATRSKSMADVIDVWGNPLQRRILAVGVPTRSRKRSIERQGYTTVRRSSRSSCAPALSSI